MCKHLGGHQYKNNLETTIRYSINFLLIQADTRAIVLHRLLKLKLLYVRINFRNKSKGVAGTDSSREAVRRRAASTAPPVAATNNPRLTNAFRRR